MAQTTSPNARSVHSPPAIAGASWRLHPVDVSIASDVASAERILREPFDVALLDVFVPGGAPPAGGIHVLGRIAADRNAPLRIVVSGLAKAAEWAHVGALGVKEVLEKPVSMGDLHAALDRELARLLHGPVEAPVAASADELAVHAKRLAVRDALHDAGSIQAAARTLGWSWQKLSYNIAALGLHELPREGGKRRRWI